MLSKNTLLNILIIVTGAGSFSYIMVDNLIQLRDYNSRMVDATALLNSRRGTSIRAEKPRDTDAQYYPHIYLLIDEASEQIQLTKDPFAKVEQLPDFKLTGMIHSDERPSAVINDQVVTTGEYIEGFQVLEIGNNFVKLSDGEFDIKLHLYSSEPEEPPSPADSPPPAPPEDLLRNGDL